MAEPASNRDMMIMPHSDKVGMDVGGGGLMTKCRVVEPVQPCGSAVGSVFVAVTVKLKVPVSVVIPLSEPSLESVIPVGSVRDAANVKGPFAPDALNVTGP